MITKLESHRRASFALTFDNGARLSIIWREMTYSDNHDLMDRPPMGELLSSKTFEAMVTDGEQQLVDAFEVEYETNPASYIPVADLPDMIAFVDGWVNQNDPVVYKVEVDFHDYYVYESQREWFEKEVAPKLGVALKEALPNNNGSDLAAGTDAKEPTK